MGFGSISMPRLAGGVVGGDLAVSAHAGPSKKGNQTPLMKKKVQDALDNGAVGLSGNPALHFDCGEVADVLTYDTDALQNPSVFLQIDAVGVGYCQATRIASVDGKKQKHAYNPFRKYAKENRHFNGPMLKGKKKKEEQAKLKEAFKDSNIFIFKIIREVQAMAADGTHQKDEALQDQPPIYESKYEDD